MKANKEFLWMLLALMGMAAMVSCSNDDDDDNDSDEGVVLRGEEITNEIRDLIIGTWKPTSNAAVSNNYFSHTHFRENCENVKFVFTKNDRALAFVNGKQADKSNGWYEDNSYTLGSEWIVYEHVDYRGEPYKFYSGNLYMSEAVREQKMDNFSYLPHAGEVLPVGKNYNIAVDIYTQKDSLNLYIVDSFYAELFTNSYPAFSIWSALVKTGSDDGLLVE